MVLQKKKRNQHLVEKACTLLRNKIRDLQSSSIGYLINRVPSSILHSQAPNSPLYPQQDLCRVTLSVIACSCFVHDCTLGKD